MVVQAETMARGHEGALCSTWDDSYALTRETRHRFALLPARVLLCVRRAEPKPLSNRWLVYPFAFRPSGSGWRGADSGCSGKWEGRMNVVLSGARYVSPALGCAVLD